MSTLPLQPHANAAVRATQGIRTRGVGPIARAWQAVLHNPRALIGGGMFFAIVLLCIITLPWTLHVYDYRWVDQERLPPQWSLKFLFGSDQFGRSVLARSLLGGVISLSVGIVAAAISVFLGVTVGMFAGFRGGWIDAALMRVVDVLYGLPYILLVLIFKIALETPLRTLLSKFTVSASSYSSLAVMFLAIGLVSWLTMARVIRGQVLSLRGQPFIEACRAIGLPESRIFLRHILPNLVGPITVYATLTIPQAILQESFLSFLGVGVDPTLPTWGALASDSRESALDPILPEWWMLMFPCLMLAVTLLALNFLGDGLRDIVDPKREAAKL